MICTVLLEAVPQYIWGNRDAGSRYAQICDAFNPVTVPAGLLLPKTLTEEILQRLRIRANG